jgi:hypothetical protein
MAMEIEIASETRAKRRFDDVEVADDDVHVAAKVQKVTGDKCDESDVFDDPDAKEPWHQYSDDLIQVMNKKMRELLVSNELDVATLAKDIQELMNPFVSEDLAKIMDGYCRPTMCQQSGINASPEEIDAYDCATFPLRGGGLMVEYHAAVEDRKHPNKLRGISPIVAYMCADCGGRDEEDIYMDTTTLDDCLPGTCYITDTVCPNTSYPMKRVEHLYKAHKIVMCMCDDDQKERADRWRRKMEMKRQKMKRKRKKMERERKRKEMKMLLRKNKKEQSTGGRRRGGDDE